MMIIKVNNTATPVTNANNTAIGTTSFLFANFLPSTHLQKKNKDTKKAVIIDMSNTSPINIPCTIKKKIVLTSFLYVAEQTGL